MVRAPAFVLGDLYVEHEYVPRVHLAQSWEYLRGNDKPGLHVAAAGRQTIEGRVGEQGHATVAEVSQIDDGISRVGNRLGARKIQIRR